jgi:diadenosine tetraphosphate (Ap4A) HIT family hydrolase
MELLYAPWRSDYVKQDLKGETCVFCFISKHEQEDADLRVLYRDEHCFVVMNKYPYTPGHFMIIPHIHEHELENLNSTIWLHMNTLAQKSVPFLKKVLRAGGINIGINLGRIGGAGIPEHLHLHLVPRWEGDTNFITTIGGARVFSTDEEKLYLELKKEFDNL